MPKMALPAALSEPTGARGIGRIDRHAGVDLFGLPPNLAPGDKSARPGKSRHQRHVLADAQFVNQAEILMNKRDRHEFRMGMDLTPAHENFARVGLIEPGENFDERRLAGAVLTDERMDLGGHDREVDAVQRKRAEKALRETPDLDRGRRVSSPWPFALGPVFGSAGAAPQAPRGCGAAA